MRKPILLAVVAALVLVAFPVGSAGADSPFEEVELEVFTSLASGPPPNGGFITVSGPICEEGWSYDLPGEKFSPRDFMTAKVLNIQAVKVFVCDAKNLAEAFQADDPEEDDVIFMRFQIHFDKQDHRKKEGGSINWVIVDGWGAYVGIAGNGHGTSVGTLVPGVTDTLTGKVRLKG